MNISSQRMPPSARRGQWWIVTMKSRSTKLLERWWKGESFTGDFRVCRISATQEISKGCWAENKAWRKSPVLPEHEWEAEDLFSSLIFNWSHPKISSSVSLKNCQVLVYYFWVLVKYNSRYWKPSVVFDMFHFSQLLVFSNEVIPTQDTGLSRDPIT